MCVSMAELAMISFLIVSSRCLLTPGAQDAPERKCSEMVWYGMVRIGIFFWLPVE